jgi:hypothetical protein
MALTRPKIWDLDTNIQYFMDPITVLHQGATQANVDVGFLFNRANGLVSNVAVYWSESAQSIVTAYTANTGVTNSNITPISYANLTIGNLLMVNGSILNVTGNINANISNSGTNYFGNVITTSGIFWANGASALSSSSYGNTQVAAYLPTYSGNLGASSFTITEIGNGNQYALTMKGAATGDQWAFTVGDTAGQNNITSLNTAGSAYAPFTVNGSSFTIGTTGAGATTSLTIDNTGAARLYGNLTYGTVPVLDGTSTVTNIGTGAALLDSFAVAVYRSGKYVMSVTDVTNTQYQTSEILLQQDGTYANIASYGILYSGASSRMTFSSNIVSGNVMLWGTGVSANNAVKLQRTLIPV